jgi:uncharacterized phiE125 gp8 family phage protein
MYRPVLTSAPSATPVSLTEAKAALDVTYTNKDTLITSLIAAATAHVDGWTGVLGRCLVTQSWQQDFDCFAYCLRLPLVPVASIASVKYDDPDDVEQTVSASNYQLLEDELGAYVRFPSTFSFPNLHIEPPRVRVAYVAGYGAASAVPDAIKQAMLLMIRSWFDNPSATVVGLPVQAMPMAVDALLAPFRRSRV